MSGNNGKSKIVRVGKIRNDSFKLPDVLLVDVLEYNLIFINQLCNKFILFFLSLLNIPYKSRNKLNCIYWKKTC